MPQHKIGKLADLDRSDLVRDAVRNRRIDRVFRHVTPDAEIIVVALLAWETPALLPHLVRRLPGARDHFAHSPHRLAVARDHADGAEIVQDVFRRDRFLSNPAFGERHVLRNVLVEMVAHHQHVQMLVERVDCEWPCGISRARQHVGLAAHANDVRCMAAARTLGVIGVDRPPFERGDRIVHEAGFVQRVGVDSDLHVVLVGHAETAIDGRRRRSPVLVELQPHGASADLFVQSFRLRAVALTEKSEIHRQIVGRLEHPLEIPRPRRACGRLGSGGRSRPTTNKGGDAARERHIDLLWTDVMNVGVDAARCQDETLAGDGFRGRAHDHARRYTGHHVGVAGFADTGNASVLHADVCFVDARPVDDERVGDHEIQCAIFADARRLAHAIAQHFAAAELAFLSVDGVIALDLRDKVGIRQPNTIASRGAVDVGVMPVRHRVAHARAPCARCRSISATVLLSPGSNRTAVPAGISSRRFCAAARSNFSALLVSAKW